MASKTAMFGKWPLLERLTNNEFLNILQYLDLEQYVMTHVFIPKMKWLPLLDANFQTLHTRCRVCKITVAFEDIKRHIASKDHLILLRTTVKQFYHPFYTFGKIDVKLARGENVSNYLRVNTLREVNIETKSFKKACTSAQEFAELAERRSYGFEEKQLIDLNLGKKITNPDDMIILVNLPFDDVSKLLFRIGNNDWENVISYKTMAKKTIFHCNICSIKCAGIENLNLHLNVYIHKLRQLELSALIYEVSSRVNKNCCIQFGNSFSFSLKNYPKNFNNCGKEMNPDLWIPNLPHGLAEKVKPLYDRAAQMFALAKNNSDERQMNKGSEEIETVEFNDILGHLGVEYVLKIMKNDDDRNPEFECGLCELFGDEQKMQRHLLNFNHRKKYLDLHYGDTVKKYESLMGHMIYNDFRDVMNEIIRKIAFEIEKYYGRCLPYTVSLADYNDRRPDLIAEVYALWHASQLRGPSFSNVVSKEEIRYLKSSIRQLASKTYEYPEYVLFTIPPKNKTYLNKLSHNRAIGLSEYNVKLDKPPSLREDSPIRGRNDDFHLERSYAAVRGRRTSSRSPVREREWNAKNQNIWDIYRREISLAANEIEIAYGDYRKNPESHPLYEEEWNDFWQRRKRDLEREGQDHRSYNFQPEWVQYFKQRIELLFGETLHKSQINIRHRLGIPLNVEEDCQQPAEAFNNYHHTDEDNSDFKERKRQRSHTSESMDEQNKKFRLEQRRDDFKADKPQMIISKINDNHSNLVHVLRLITALEEHLGSLGGKVMDLFSSVLQLEKCFQGNIKEFEGRVLTAENCNLLETAMEKLKGVLFTGLLDEKKVAGFNRVITYTSNLLKYAENMGWRPDNSLIDEKPSSSSGRERVIQDQAYDIRYRNDEKPSKLFTGRALSDTLMDLAKTSETSEQQTYFEKEPDCPPPPNIKDTNMNANLFTDFKGQTTNSFGLASFDTNLSLDDAYNSQKLRRNLTLQPEIGQFHRKPSGVGNNVYNNSFKYNNETRTNINSPRNNGTSFQF